MRRTWILILIVLLPSGALAQSGSVDQPVDGTWVELPRLTPDDIDDATLESARVLLSAYHQLPPRSVFEAQMAFPRDVLIAVALHGELLPMQRARAVEALSMWGGDAVLAVYGELLAGQDAGERLLHSALLGLGTLHDDRAVALIAPFVEHDQLQIRLSAIAALGELDTPSAVAVLETAAQREDNRVARERIQAALMRTQ